MAILGSDPLVGAETTLTETHRMIHDQRGFTVSGKDILEGGGSVDILLRAVPDVNPHVRAVAFNCTQSPFEVEVWENPTVAANGTECDVYNNARPSSRTSALLAYTGPTITNVGSTRIGYALAPRTSVVTEEDAEDDSGSGASLAGVEEEWILKIDTPYLIRINGLFSGRLPDGILGWRVFWYEAGHKLPAPLIA